jgi:hypothetical protein
MMGPASRPDLHEAHARVELARGRVVEEHAEIDPPEAGLVARPAHGGLHEATAVAVAGVRAEDAHAEGGAVHLGRKAPAAQLEVADHAPRGALAREQQPRASPERLVEAPREPRTSSTDHTRDSAKCGEPPRPDSAMCSTRCRA